MASSSSSQDRQELPQQPQTSASPPLAQTGMAANDESTPPLSKPAAGVIPEFPAQASTSSSTRTYANILPPENMRFPWMFDPLTGGALDLAGSSSPMVPILCPFPFPGYPGHVEERQLRNAGIFAVPMVPMIGPFPGYPPSGLIPISYNVPQNVPLPGNITNPAASQPGERGIPAQAQEAAALVPLQDAGLNFLHPAAAAQAGQVQIPEGQRQIVRRFHVAFQIDLLLILKLAVVVFIFNQDGSKDRLLLLLFLAGLIYLYQTGALSPLLRWISQSAQRAMLPPQQQQQPVRAVQADAQLRDQVQGENAAAANAAAPAAGGVGGPAPVAAADNVAGGPGGAGVAVDNPAGDHAQQQAPAHGAPWWGFLKEVQMLVVGFVTSLLPGFHQHMD